ncbi:MAG: type VI secretion system tip protein VgrG [Burkholderiaceae bacterium]|jgi:type VI secretion system secreted protein VgrG|nr:type VI secretion system tip protein VgrG [Burkholderiaceae bacterium]
MLSNPAFSFRVSNQSKNLFEVVSFTGREGISEIYEFTILLISEQADVDSASMMQGLATFSVNPPFSGESPAVFSGVIVSCEALHRIQDYHLYRVCMRHKFWRLSLPVFSRVFVDQKPQDFMTTALDDGEMHSGVDYDMRLHGGYRAYDFVCQYNESAFAFVSRWLESLGIYYWFAHADDGGKCIMADDKSAHAHLGGHEKCRFAPPSGMAVENPGQIITEFTCATVPVPGKIKLKTYNRQRPSLDLLCEADVRNGGVGTWYYYGDNYLDKEEGQKLAQLRSQELLCQETRFWGVSHNPSLRPGYLFNLEHHYRQKWNQPYLTVGVLHEGSQSRQVVRHYGIGSLDDADRLFYRNRFQCIPADVQYRPPRLTPLPKVAGAVPAVIDAEGTGEFAVIDSQGRYKVRLPFDIADRGAGKSSCWIPMMQPYGGAKMGFHAPLHKGTEVLVMFMDGNPDLPVVAGVVPNPQNPSRVTDTNATRIQFDSASGQNMHMEDAPGKEHILMTSLDGSCVFKIGNIE